MDKKSKLIEYLMKLVNQKEVSEHELERLIRYGIKHCHIPTPSDLGFKCTHTNTNSNVTRITPSNKGFRCSICGKEFTLEEMLEEYKNIKPYISPAPLSQKSMRRMFKEVNIHIATNIAIDHDTDSTKFYDYFYIMMPTVVSNIIVKNNNCILSMDTLEEKIIEAKYNIPDTNMKFYTKYFLSRIDCDYDFGVHPIRYTALEIAIPKEISYKLRRLFKDNLIEILRLLTRVLMSEYEHKVMENGVTLTGMSIYKVSRWFDLQRTLQKKG